MSDTEGDIQWISKGKNNKMPKMYQIREKFQIITNTAVLRKLSG